MNSTIYSILYYIAIILHLFGATRPTSQHRLQKVLQLIYLIISIIIHMIVDIYLQIIAFRNDSSIIIT